MGKITFFHVATSLWFILSLLIFWPLLCLVQLPFLFANKFLGHDPRRVWLGNIFRFFNALALWSNPFISIKYKYSNRVPKETKKLIIICNHQSNLDPFVLSSSLLPFESKYVGKSSLFSIPFGGWGMTMAGDIPIHFVSKSYDDMTTIGDSSKKCIEKMRETLAGDCGLAVFPEGKRNAHPNKGFTEFKIGAFKMAKETEADILPVVVDGTGKIWGVHDTLLTKGKVGVVFGNIIKQSDYENASDLLEASRKIMAEMYEEATRLVQS